MAEKTIWDYLLEIQTAVYGREIRGAIHDSIKECYENVVAGVTLADDAAAAAASAAGDAVSAKQQALSAATTANNSANTAAGAATIANNSATLASQRASEALDAANAANQAATNAGNAISYFCDTYSSSTQYSVGDYSIRSGKLYRCIVPTPSSGEAWTPSHWRETTVGEQLKLNTPGTMTTDDIGESETRKFLPYDTSDERFELEDPLYVPELKCDMGELGSDQSVGEKIEGLTDEKEDKGSITIGGTVYQIRVGTVGAVGYLTLVLEE